MMTAAEHFERAEALLREAEQAPDPKARIELRTMARTWRQAGADARLQEDIIAEARHHIQ